MSAGPEARGRCRQPAGRRPGARSRDRPPQRRRASAHRPILPVLSRGARAAGCRPLPARSGPGTIALAVLDGLLVTRARSRWTGRGDVIAPWGSAWVACTPVRLAVIGRAYLDALRPWPAMPQRVRSRRHAAPSGAHRRRRDARGATARRCCGGSLCAGASVRGAGIALPRARRARAEPDARASRRCELARRSRRCATTALGATRDGALWLPGRPRPRSRATRAPRRAADARRRPARARASGVRRVRRAVRRRSTS